MIWAYSFLSSALICVAFHPHSWPPLHETLYSLLSNLSKSISFVGLYVNYQHKSRFLNTKIYKFKRFVTHWFFTKWSSFFEHSGMSYVLANVECSANVQFWRVLNLSVFWAAAQSFCQKSIVLKLFNFVDLSECWMFS